MSHIPRGLCVLLIVWSVSSRSSTADRAESPHSTPWWDRHDFPQIKAESERLRGLGDYAALESHLLWAIEHAQRLQELPAAVAYQTALANTYFYLHRYSNALEAYGQARSLAEEAALWNLAVAVAPGISGIYEAVGDFEAALAAIQRGIEAARRIGEPPAELRFIEARLRKADPASIRDLIQSARGKPALEAAGWDLLAEWSLEQGDLAGAQAALGEGLRLRRSLPEAEKRSSYWRLATLRLAQAKQAGGGRNILLDAAERYVRQARELGSPFERPILIHQQGLIERARGKNELALDLFREAVETVGERRSIFPVAVSALAAADGQRHQEQIVRTFVEAAAETALATHDPVLTRQGFLAAERYRADSLRRTRELAPVWRRKLPDRYWEALGELRSAEGGPAGSGSASGHISRLRLEISEMESHAGIGISLNHKENFLSQDSLNHFQGQLGSDDLILSFYLGQDRSYLWAASRDDLHVIALEPVSTITTMVRAFRQAVLGHRKTEEGRAGRELYQVLFGQLNGTELAKKTWLLSLEGVLFDLPFAALRTDGAGEEPEAIGPEYLVQKHVLQIVPGALLLGQRDSQPGDEYLAVGDPVYNFADPRYGGRREARTGSGGSLNRLVASGDEIRRSAEAWNRTLNTQSAPRSASGIVQRRGPGTTLPDATAQRVELLEGRQANRKELLAALRRHPGVLHLSTHVIQSTQHGDQAFVALSLGAEGAPELLAATDVAMLDVADALVVMTGCASGTGEVVPGAGLLGLARAWHVAGAASVVATAWPIPDASGNLVPDFFGSLRETSPAEALRRGQINAIHSATWQSDPAYWASFQVTGVTR